MFEQSINVDRMEQAVSLFGSFDENIRLIERHYAVDILTRGTDIKVSGEPEAVAKAVRAIQGLLQLINRGEQVTINNKSRDFFFLKRYDADIIIRVVIALIQEKLPRYVDAKPYEIQVLTPMRKGLLGVERLNQILQRYLNPPDEKKKEKEIGQRLFREGDKVMQVKNNYQLEWEILGRYKIPVDKGVGVFNGDTGIMTEINEFAETATVEFEDGRQAEYSFKQLEELELAYAVTIHKSQGSEYPAVILPILSGPRMLMNRNLLYTAVTRARKCVTVVGSETTFAEMIRNEKQQQRYSSLDRRIRELDESEQKESAIGEKGLS